MHLMIVGTRGIPAQHGGFETFAEDLSLYLVDRGHRVTVYCEAFQGGPIVEDVWNGVRRVLIPTTNDALGTITFDWKSTMHARDQDGVVLTLGYNTAIFSLAYRLRRVPNVMNMDGIEWKRQKWSRSQRAWLWFNEWAGGRLANHMVADHPQIALHLRRHASTERMTMIPYGAEPVFSASSEALDPFELRSKKYYLLIARPEPENSILEIVNAFSSQSIQTPLVVLGDYRPHQVDYHKQVMEAAGERVRFVGAIYDRQISRALRFHARAYIHGHQVGGTNPSLVESLAAGNAIIAHDHRFTRWVAGENARYFHGTGDLVKILTSLEADTDILEAMREGSRRRHREQFGKDSILARYEEMLMRVSHCYDQRFQLQEENT
jgi:glycosyltransferase involved in cell wall biosynthesis